MGILKGCKTRPFILWLGLVISEQVVLEMLDTLLEQPVWCPLTMKMTHAGFKKKKKTLYSRHKYARALVTVLELETHTVGFLSPSPTYISKECDLG